MQFSAQRTTGLIIFSSDSLTHLLNLEMRESNTMQATLETKG